MIKKVYRKSQLLKTQKMIHICDGWWASVQRVSQQPDKVSLMFMYVCHIQLKMWLGSTELGNGARPFARSCNGIFSQHMGEKKKWVGSLSSPETWDLGRWIFVSAPSLMYPSALLHMYINSAVIKSLFFINAWPFIFLCRLKINWTMELHFSPLFLEPAWSWTIFL